jgi:sulfonate transport system permease protein
MARSSLQRRLGGALPAVAGIALVLLLWHLASVVFADRRSIPAPLRVAQQIAEDRSYLAENSAVTLREAMVGYLWGNAAAIMLAVVFVQSRTAERALLRLAIASYCVPLVAIAPVLVVALPGDGPKYTLAALAVFFTTLVATIVGLRSSDPTSLEVVRASGGTSWQALRFVRLRSALPSLFAGLCVAGRGGRLGVARG